MLTRFLPGTVAVVAALTMPEFSVGAGDVAEGGRFDDPPEPAVKPAQGRVKIGQAPVKPQLAGVRYAAMLDLDLSNAATLALPAAMANLPAGNRSEPEPVAAASAPLGEAVTPTFVPPPPALATTPLAEQDKDRVDVFAPASMPAPPVATMSKMVEAVPVIVPAILPAVEDAPSLPQAESAGAAALPAPVMSAAPGPAPLSATKSSAAEPPALAAALPVRATQVPPAARGMIDQVTPARIAAAQALKTFAEPLAMSAPAARPASVAPLTASTAVAAPTARAPISAPAASAPAPAKAVAIAVSRPASPAITAPPASKPATPAITAQLTTRVDGKAAGAVDFQQTSGGLKVRLGSIVEVLADRYDASQLDRIRNSAAGNQYLSLAELQAQGVPISYDPVYDEFNVGLTDTRPKAARKVNMDQISTPERGLDTTGMAQVPRPR